MTRTTSWLKVSILLLGVALARGARAETRYTVNLKDGGILSGELVELAPERKIVLRLATGEVREIPWADITSHEKHDEPPATPAATATASPPQPTPPASPPGLATPEQIEEERRNQQRIEVVGDRDGINLQRVTGGSSGSAGFLGRYAYYWSESWQHICTVPCNQTVNAALLYRVDGTGVTTSDEFRIPRSATGPTKLVIEAGSSIRRGFGWMSLILGIGGLVAGGTATAILTNTSDPGTIVPVVVGGFAGGVVLTVLGAIGLATSGTTVKDGTGKVLATRHGEPAGWVH
jgi:hypothetical protein